MAEVTLGGDRIGSGEKIKVNLHDFGMNSFNLEQDFKSSMAPGVLYPFVKLVGTNHGTFDVDLDTFVRTLPTRGPLFGSFKLQLDLYNAPFRLYQGILHNNSTDIGLQMDKVFLPKIKIRTIDGYLDGIRAARPKGSTNYDYQVNTSALLKYMGISGVGINRNTIQTEQDLQIERKFNAVPILAYYDIFKNYYSNKQERDAWVITPGKTTNTSISDIKRIESDKSSNFPEDSATAQIMGNDTHINLKIIGENLNKVIEIEINNGQGHYNYSIEDIEYLNIGKVEFKNEEIVIDLDVMKFCEFEYNSQEQTSMIVFNGEEEQVEYAADIQLRPFDLRNIDDMRKHLLKQCELGDEVVIGDDWDDQSGTDGTGLPYSALTNQTTAGITWNAFTMNGLLVKTYQSDLFNNWLKQSTVDLITSMTSVDTSSGSFTMDSLNLAEKFYELLNRIMVSGGTYQDWQDAVYGEGAARMTETPIYIGGMAAEIMFEEVIASTENQTSNQALGSLGGKGTQIGKRGGNNIHVRMDEPGYIIGIVSITPRICYSQGNDWDMTELDTLDDLHKPNLDGIGFQDLMVEQMAWWDTATYTENSEWKLIRNSAGKQTAWINYQTAIDKCYGDFAKSDGYAFMVLNRNYEWWEDDHHIEVKDVTTYIDPAKFNYAFAYTELDAQNFWVQIHSKIVARRKMGAQQLPNL